MAVSSSHSKAHQPPARQKNYLLNAAVAIGYSIWIIASFFIANFMGLGIVTLAVRAGLPFASLRDSVQSTVLAAIIFVCMVALLLLVDRWIVQRKPVNFKKLLAVDKPLGFLDIGLGLTAIIPSFILAGILLAITVAIFPNLNLDEQQDVGFSGLALRFEYLLAFITLVVIAPVVEELIFRGFLYSKLRPRIGVVFTTLLVSLVFAFLHLQINVGITVFALSLVLCTLREVTGKVWAGMILHAFKNAIAFYFLFIAPMLQ